MRQEYCSGCAKEIGPCSRSFEPKISHHAETRLRWNAVTSVWADRNDYLNTWTAYISLRFTVGNPKICSCSKNFTRTCDVTSSSVNKLRRSFYSFLWLAVWRCSHVRLLRRWYDDWRMKNCNMNTVISANRGTIVPFASTDWKRTSSSSDRIAGVSAEIRKGHLTNPNLKRYHYTSLAYKVFISSKRQQRLQV